MGAAELKVVLIMIIVIVIGFGAIFARYLSFKRKQAFDEAERELQRKQSSDLSERLMLEAEAEKNRSEIERLEMEIQTSKIQTMVEGLDQASRLKWLSMESQKEIELAKLELEKVNAEAEREAVQHQQKMNAKLQETLLRDRKELVKAQQKLAREMWKEKISVYNRKLYTVLNNRVDEHELLGLLHAHAKDQIVLPDLTSYLQDTAKMLPVENVEPEEEEEAVLFSLDASRESKQGGSCQGGWFSTAPLKDLPVNRSDTCLGGGVSFLVGNP